MIKSSCDTTWMLISDIGLYISGGYWQIMMNCDDDEYDDKLPLMQSGTVVYFSTKLWWYLCLAYLRGTSVVLR